MDNLTRSIELRENERIDDLQRNGYRIIQNSEKFCFGMDAVLLSGFARVKTGARVLDMGTGTGIIPILLEGKTKAAHLTGLEIQEESADMARRSILLNHLEKKIDIVTGDIKEAGNLFQAASFDVITCNPPYMIGQHGIANPDTPKAIARHEVLCTLEDVVKNAALLLKPGGYFFMVHRPSRIVDICCLGRQYGLEVKELQFVSPNRDGKPNILLVHMVKGGGRETKMLPPLYVYDMDGNYTEELLAAYE